MFFGREAEFELVRKRFTETEAMGGLLVFCGERRSGKTSILFQILDGRLGPDFLPVLIDMQSMAIESELDFLSKIATAVYDDPTKWHKIYKANQEQIVEPSLIFPAQVLDVPVD